MGVNVPRRDSAACRGFGHGQQPVRRRRRSRRRRVPCPVAVHQLEQGVPRNRDGHQRAYRRRLGQHPERGAEVAGHGRASGQPMDRAAGGRAAPGLAATGGRARPVGVRIPPAERWPAPAGPAASPLPETRTPGARRSGAQVLASVVGMRSNCCRLRRAVRCRNVRSVSVVALWARCSSVAIVASRSALVGVSGSALGVAGSADAGRARSRAPRASAF